MKSAPFDYVRPKTVAEASALLAQDGVTTAAIAGGQSLIPMLSLRAAQVDLLVDLSRLEELKSVRETPETVEIGALTTHAAFEDGKLPDPSGGLMPRVAGTISYRAVRNHGTIGGSVALADPAADWPGCLIALGASVRIGGANGTRQQPVAEFVQGTYTTSLAAGEIVLGFDLPKPAAPPRWGFAKVARKSGAFANSIAFVVAQGKGGPVTAVLAAAGPRPIVLTAARELAGGAVSDDRLRTAVAADLKAHLPDADPYEHRLHIATVVRAAKDMWARA
jgi:aerobic carbon-monoxide dehydrogenase medium subunit